MTAYFGVSIGKSETNLNVESEFVFQASDL